MAEFKEYTTSEIIQFVNSTLGENRQKGDEITLSVCPYCGKEKKMNINVNTGLFRCWSAECDTAGGFGKLVKDFGTKENKRVEYIPNVKKEHTVNLNEEMKKKKFLNLDVEHLEYFNKRCISKETLEKCKVKMVGDKITFGYKIGEKVIAVKYRTIDKKFTSEAGSKATLWHVDSIDINKTWVICEGEIDHMSFVECGINNVTSVSHGAGSLDWITTFYDKINECKEIILAFDTDGAGKIAVSKILKRIDIKKVKIMTYRGEKDCNDLLVKHGKEAVIQEFKSSQAYNFDGLYNIGEITDEYIPERIKSGFECLNGSMGGFVMGGITVITGIPGSGKSTLTSQIVLDTVDQHEKIYVYTGELRKEVYMQWLLLQACGVNDTNPMKCQIRQKIEYKAKKEKVPLIKAWLNENVYLYEKEKAATEEELFASMEFAYKKHGIKLFIVDNLMKIKFENTSHGKYDSQYKFVDALKSFANNYNVHIILVAHPKKPENGTKISNMYDISGASEIVNLSDNVVIIHRYTQKEISENSDFQDRGITTNLSIFKNREFGDTTINMMLCFDWRNRRFTGEGENVKRYGWEYDF